MRGQSAQRRLFVLPHEAAIAEDIGTEYGGELTFQYPPIARLIILPRADDCQNLFQVACCTERRGRLPTGLRYPSARRKSLRVDPATRLALLAGSGGHGDDTVGRI